MANLKEETINVLKENGKTPDDVRWCGSEDFGWFSFDQLLKIAPDYYDSGYGGQEIAEDLIIVGEDWWLERKVYGGSEWWEYKTTPQKPKNQSTPKTIRNGESWATIKEMNQEGGKYQEK